MLNDAHNSEKHDTFVGEELENESDDCSEMHEAENKERETAMYGVSCKEELGKIIGAEGEVLGSIDIEVEDAVMEVQVPSGDSVVDLTKLCSSDFFESFIEERICYYFQEDSEAIDLSLKDKSGVKKESEQNFSSSVVQPYAQMMSVESNENPKTENCSPESSSNDKEWESSEPAFYDDVDDECLEFSRHKSYSCNKCGKVFSKSSLYQKHCISHLRDKFYKCSMCPEICNTYSDLEKHEENHDKTSKSEICRESFRVVLGDGDFKTSIDGQYTCKQCSKTFNKLSLAKIHLRSHTAVLDNPRKLCSNDKMSERQTNGKLHIEACRSKPSSKCRSTSPRGKKSHVCNVCNKHFSQSSQLKVHERVHSGERPYACNQCNKTFSQSSALKSHRRVHTGERPYACQVCNKVFTVSCNLRAHEKTHIKKAQW